MSGGKSKKQTVGYRYGMGLHFGICHGPVDYLSEIRVGDRTAHDVTITGSQEIYIDEPKLFGGDKREGGIQGYADVLGGSETQGVNTYLQEQLGPEARVPAFRGLFAVLYKGGLVTSNNPYIKPWAFKVGRIKAGWGRVTTEEVNELATDYIAPWVEGTRDPRDLVNGDFSYFYDPPPLGPVGGDNTEYATLQGALAAMQAARGFSISGSSVAWALPGASGGFSPFNAVSPGDSVALGMLFNSTLIDSIPEGKFIGDLVNGVNAGGGFGELYSAGVAPYENVWWSGRVGFGPSGIYAIYDNSSGPPAPTFAWSGVNNCSVSFGCPYPGVPLLSLYRIDDQVVNVVRVPTEPPLPGSELPDYPPDPANFWWDEGTGTLYSKQPWVYTAGSYRQLSIYATDVTSVTGYPLGPILPVGDASDTEAFWTAAYNAAVSAGTMAAGKTYNAAGTGGINTYPRNASYAYARTYEIVVDEPPDPDLAQIDADMNPAHIIRQCITNVEWGMGYPDASIDSANFTAIAQALFDEGFGLSFQWTQQQPVEEFIGEVLNHCGGVWYADPRTGLFSLALIRDDYSVSDLRVFDESNIIALESYQRPGYGELVNQIVVSWTDVPNNKTATTPPLQDPACIQAQGCVIGEVRQYPGITKSGLAQRVALRDLIAASTPLASLKLRVNREAWDLIPGKDVIVVNWDKLGIVQLVCRVLKVDRGTLQDGSILLEVAEDVFGLPSNVYVTQEEEGWIEPDVTPDDIEVMALVESPYWDLARNLSAADLDYTDVDAGYVFTLAARSTPVETAYNIWSRTGAADYEEVGAGIFAPTALLNGAIDQAETSITLDNGIDLSQVAVGDRCLIGEGRLAEFCEVLTLNTTTGVMTVSRAVLDTTPQSHADNTRVWFVEDFFGVDPTERATTDEVDVKLTAVATGGETELADATEQTITMAGRFGRPYPPGQIRINGDPFPATVDTTEAASEGFVIAWAHRDRTTQDVELVSQNEGDIGPEAGTTYTVELYNDTTDVLVDSVSGITGTSLSLTATDSYTARLEVFSVRDGIESWQRQVRRFFLLGTDVFVTEDGDYFITEDGQLLAPE